MRVKLSLSWRFKLRPYSHTLQTLIVLLSVIELLFVKEKETKKKNEKETKKKNL